MKNSLWKLAAVVAVAGFGGLIVLQAQRGLTVPGIHSDAAASEPETTAQSDQPPPLGESDALDSFALPPETETAAAPPWPAEEPPAGNGEPAAPAGGIDFNAQVPTVAEQRPAPQASGPAPFDPSAPSGPALSAEPQTLPDNTAARPLSTPATPPVTAMAAPGKVQLVSNDAPAGRARLAAFDPSEPEPFAADPKPAAEPKPAPTSLPLPGGPTPADAAPSAYTRSGSPAEPPAMPPPAPAVEMTIKAKSAEPAAPASAALESAAPPSAEMPPPFPPASPPPAPPVSDESPKPNEAPPLSDSPKADPFGDYTIRPDLPSPSVQAPQSAFPPSDGADLGRPADASPADAAELGNLSGAAEPSEAAERRDRPMPPAPRMATEPSNPIFGSEPEPPAAPDSAATTEPPPADNASGGLPDLGAAAPDGRAPDPLSPPPSAAPLTPSVEELKGDGTVDGDAPRGTQRPQLKIEKLAPPNAVLGQPLVYNIVVKNVGNSAAYEVTVEDRIPKGTRLDGTIPRAEMVGKKLVWKLGKLEPGNEAKIAVRVVPLSEGEVGSVATVNFVAEVAAETVVTAPKLELSLIGPPQGQVGTPVTYKFKVTNNGSGDATNVWIRNVIPDALQHPDGNDLEYEVGVLPAGKSREVALTVTPLRAGPTKNRAVLTADGGVTIEAESPIDVLGDQLSIVRSGPKQQFLGRPAVYVNKVTNDADRPATGVLVVETVPDGMEFLAATADGQYDQARRTVTWRIDQLAPHGSRDVQVTLLPQRIGTVQSRVALTGPTGGQTDITSVTRIEGFAALGLETVPLESPLTPGEQTALRLIARNRGNQPATNVQVTFTLPAEVEFVSAQGPTKFSQEGQKVVFQPVPGIDGGGQAQFTVLLKAGQGGNARVQIETASDQLKRPLTREEIIYILPAN